MAENVARILTALRKRAGLSRDDLASLAGFGRKTSLQYYETASKWEGRRFPWEFVAKVAPALIGKGQPPIEATEVYQLSAGSLGVIITSKRVVAVPVVEWSALSAASLDLDRIPTVGLLEVPGLATGSYLAAIVKDGHAAQVAPMGSRVVLDVADRELKDRECFLIVVQDEPKLVRYRANPPRFESLAFPALDPVFHTTYVEITGRLVAVITFF